MDVQSPLSSRVFDVRVHNGLTEPTDPWMGDVSLGDMLGASLVTYDQHIVPAHEAQPLEPKAVYVQYHSIDPVTHRAAPVVVPAQMSLDVFADPSMFWVPVEEEEPVEEEPEEEEEEDRRKLRSSIKGDPILMRAKPAPPPDPYFAPLRHETLNAQRVRVSRAVEGSGTMSSFLKASGKDKYCRSRLREIDQILKQTLPYEPSEGGSAMKARSLPSPRRTPRAADRDGTGPLVAQMAMHIQRMPQFHKGRVVQPCDDFGPGGDPADGEGHHGGGVAGESHRGSLLAAERPEAGAAGLGEDALDRFQSRHSSVAQSAADPSGGADGGETKHALGSLPSLKAGAKVKLRDLDPHLDISRAVPTQQMHSNWPDGLKRQVARHFYGMSHGQILEEEEKERLRGHRSRGTLINGKEGGAEDLADNAGNDQVAAATAPSIAGSTQGLSQSPRRPGRRGVGGGAMVAHGLEIRLKNSDRAERVVVGRHTERSRGKEEGAVRPCMLLGQQAASPKKLSMKY